MVVPNFQSARFWTDGSHVIFFRKNARSIPKAINRWSSKRKGQGMEGKFTLIDTEAGTKSATQPVHQPKQSPINFGKYHKTCTQDSSIST
jgi:hypothetical protein